MTGLFWQDKNVKEKSHKHLCLLVFGAYGAMPLLENISKLKSNNKNEEEDLMDGY